MQFTINKADILKELTLVQGVVERKNTIPILSNLLIESQGHDQIQIIGTDLDVSLRTKVAADVSGEGAMVITARKLFDIVRSLPEAPIHFRQESNDWVTIECERSRFRVVAQAREHFPSVPTWSAAEYRIEAEVLKTLVGRTIFAITQEESRYTLNGALFRLFGDGVRMVATDGHRLAFIEKTGLELGVGSKTNGKGVKGVSNQASDEVKALIPKKTLAELMRLAMESDDLVEFAKDENHLFFRVGDRVLISRMLSGQFPNYELVMPKDNDRAVQIEGVQFQSAIRRVSLMADERSRAIKIVLGAERMDITSQSSEVGEARETLQTDYDGPDITIGFNAQYIADFLNVAGEGDVRFEFKDGQSQAQLRPVDDSGYDYRYVVMPMRL